MSFHRDQFRSVISEVLQKINLDSLSAQNLLMGTAAQESRFGHYLFQRDGGPALGVFQMEPGTCEDIWENYIENRWELFETVTCVCDVYIPNDDYLKYDLRYQIVMARIHYLRVPEKLPKPNDIEGMARYWKKYYNTEKGKGTTDEFINNYKRFCL